LSFANRKVASNWLKEMNVLHAKDLLILILIQLSSMAEKSVIISSCEEKRDLEGLVPSEVLQASRDDIQRAIPALAKDPNKVQAAENRWTMSTEMFFNLFNNFKKAMMEAIKSEGHVIGSKVSAVELEQIKQYSRFWRLPEHLRLREGCHQGQVSAIKTIKYRDVDYDRAKKEVMGYFQERGEAYASEIEEDLELDYKLICQIVDELKREGRLEVL
jgi:hypothetical protein